MDVWGRLGEKVYSKYIDGGGDEIFEYEGKFRLYYIPPYGGEPQYEGEFEELHVAIMVAESFT